MDTFLIVLAIILLIGGIACCFIPFLPGTPLAYGSLILLQLLTFRPFTDSPLTIWTLATILVVAADYYIPIWGSKRFRGTSGGVWGASIGLVFGIFLFPPIGLIIGPFIEVFIGEIINDQDTNKAFRSALGSFIGFVAGTIMKLGISIVMGYYFFTALW
ncbi:MAG: DUF456 domain-containing protein [Bacteroidales bacterium]|nr:DUF456 domain-containing protein [Bacteroidales bacterium]